MIAPAKADQFLLRLPPGLRERLAQRAVKTGRSMNTEIVAAIVKALDDAGVLDNLIRRVERLEARARRLL